MLRNAVALIFLITMVTGNMMAQSEQNRNIVLEQYQWENRIALIFAPDTSSKLYLKQLKEFEGENEGFQDRDLLTVYFLSQGESYVDERTISSNETKKLFEKYGVTSEQFTIILIGKDGTAKLRRSGVLKTDELYSVIDAMLMRQREMQQNH